MPLLLVLLAGLGLILAPLVLIRLDGSLPPRWLAALSIWAIAGGVLTLTTFLGLLAAPPVLRLLDLGAVAHVCDRLLLHLGVSLPPAVGWVGPLGLGWTVGTIATSLVRSGRLERRLLAAARPLAIKMESVPYRVAVLGVGRESAFSVGNGHRGLIIVSSDLVARLSERETNLVLHHEAAHLDHRHSRVLRWLVALEMAFSMLPGLPAAMGATRLAIERWADEAAVAASGEYRHVARSALLKAVGVEPSATPSLSDMASLVHRIDALTGPAPTVSPLRFSFAGALLSFTAAISVAGFWTWTSHGHAALALAGWCPI